MTKTFCDRCGDEANAYNVAELRLAWQNQGGNADIMPLHEYGGDLCGECCAKAKAWIDKFMKAGVRA